MASSIEGRPPFLDHRLVEYADSLPPYVYVITSTAIISWLTETHLAFLSYSTNSATLSSVKILPSPDSSSPLKWVFTEKWILRQAVKPFVTDELFARKKSQYNVPISKTISKAESSSLEVQNLTPLQILLKKGLTRESVENLGWANWEYIERLLGSYMASMETPVDGGLDKRARVLLCVLSFVVFQRRFEVPTARV